MIMKAAKSSRISASARYLLGGVLMLFALAVFAIQTPATPVSPTPASLTVVMDDNYPPYILRAPDGELEGYLVDAWRLWEKKTGVPVKIIAQEWGAAQKTMAGGRADVIDTIFRTPQRELTLDFGLPYETLPVVIYTHDDITGIDDVDALQGFVVGAKAGDACIDKLNAGGVGKVQTYGSYAALLQASLENKVRVFCMDEAPANYLIQRASAEHKFLKAFTIDQGEFHRAVHKGDAATLALVERGFAAFSEVERQDLHDKWLGQGLSNPLHRLLVTGLQIAAMLIAALVALALLLRGLVKRRTAALFATQQQLQATLDAVPDLLFELDADGRYLDAWLPCARPKKMGFQPGCKSNFRWQMVCMFSSFPCRASWHLPGKFRPTSCCRATLPNASRPKTGCAPVNISYSLFLKTSMLISTSRTAKVTTCSPTDNDRRVLVEGETVRSEETNAVSATGKIATYQSTKLPLYREDGSIYALCGISIDITGQKLATARIEKLANYDQLTGLPNRALLAERFKYVLSLAQRNRGQMALMFMDLDHFKGINDTLGHTLGDQLLVEVARRIKLALREEDTVSRLGGDEFVIILPDTDADGAGNVASKLLETISQPCLFEHHELMITPSIGIAIYPHDGEDFETLSKNADTAMYRVKRESRNGFRFFTAEMQVHSVRTLQLAVALRRALARNELQLHYQPQVSMRDGSIVGAEALLRWQHPDLGMISPVEFIPIAEASGLILPIGEWVLRTAALQVKAWMESGLAPMVMAVNLSAVQFRQSNLTERVVQILDEVNLPHEFIEMELTEATAMDNPEAAIAVMDQLHGRGIRMSIDDFGTGYSSLSYLKKFKAYKLKIDQSFVRDISEDPDDKAIVTAIINMATSLGMQTIAEGVETSAQLAFLRLQGCDEAQGYYFSKPLPVAAFEAFMRARALATRV